MKIMQNDRTSVLDRIGDFQRPELYEYVSESNPMMQAAKHSAFIHSRTYTFPIGAVIVSHNVIVSESGNGNGYHEAHTESPGHKGGCIRRYISEQLEISGKPKLASGEGFDLCPGCNPNAHAEARVISEARDQNTLVGATLYLYGHWWCCEDCWSAIRTAGITRVCLVEKFKEKDELIAWRNEFNDVISASQHNTG